MLLAQSGFAAGATVGGLSIDTFGMRSIPLVALVFVLGSIAVATTLRPVITHAGPRAA